MLYNRNWHVYGDDIYAVTVDRKKTDREKTVYKVETSKFEALPRLNFLTNIDELQRAISAEIRRLEDQLKAYRSLFDELQKKEDYKKDDYVKAVVNAEIIEKGWDLEYKYAFAKETLALRRKQSKNLKKSRAKLCSAAMRLAKLYSESGLKKPLPDIREDFALNMHKYKLTYSCNLVKCQ